MHVHTGMAKPVPAGRITSLGSDTSSLLTQNTAWINGAQGPHAALWARKQRTMTLPLEGAIIPGAAEAAAFSKSNPGTETELNSQGWMVSFSTGSPKNLQNGWASWLLPEIRQLHMCSSPSQGHRSLERQNYQLQF